jgi:hypothetical protein
MMHDQAGQEVTADDDNRAGRTSGQQRANLFFRRGIVQDD